VVEISVAQEAVPEQGVVVVLVGTDGSLSAAAAAFDREGIVSRALGLPGPKRRHGRIVSLPLPAGLRLDRLLVVVVGKPEGLAARDMEELGAAIVRQLEADRVGEAVIASPAGLELGLEEDAAIAAMALGAELRAYRFDKYRRSGDGEEDEERKPLARLRFLSAGPAGTALARVRGLAGAVAWTRDLVAEPANVLYPESFARICESLSEVGVEVEVLRPAELERLGMRALLAVGQGSAHPPHVVIMRWKGAEQEAPLALVGKGVCFDSGGISLKPAGGMQDMKWDMAGAAAVAGAMRALAARRAAVDVVGAIGLVENMPSGTAQRPGDVIRAYSGKTIEVVNTDAEGRLLLADVLAYVCERFAPRAVVDLATLTGAVIVALGHERAGLFATDDDLAENLLAAGEEVGELLWRLPLDKAYSKHIRSDIAEIKNVGRGREAGSIAGAVFLREFVGDRPWAHIDIAGVAWSDRDLTLLRKGATGFGVRLLDRLVARRFEGR